MSIESFLDCLTAIELNEANLQKMLDESNARFNLHRDVLTAEANFYAEKATAGSTNYYPQTSAELKIINVLLEYVKNNNTGTIILSNRNESVILVETKTNVHVIQSAHGSMNIQKHGNITGTAMITNDNHGGDACLRNQQTSTASYDFTPVQNAVLHFLKTVTTMTGCSATDISEQFSENQVEQTLKFLADEGHIYSTTDDRHYRAVSS